MASFRAASAAIGLARPQSVFVPMGQISPMIMTLLLAPSRPVRNAGQRRGIYLPAGKRIVEIASAFEADTPQSWNGM
jgi:hypothetical protein